MSEFKFSLLPYSKQLMGLKTTDLENQKSTLTPQENSVCCLVKCLIALVSIGTKQA